jgi:hypothetical protein
MKEADQAAFAKFAAIGSFRAWLGADKLNQALRLKTPGGVENGFPRRLRRPAEHAPGFV